MRYTDPADQTRPKPTGNSGLLPTNDERQAEEERKHNQAKEEAEDTYKQRQLGIAEAANKLARANFILTGFVAILTAVAAGAAIYQGVMNHRSWVAASDTLQQMRKDSQDSGKQFQVQLGRFDDGLGRTGLLAVHAGEQARASQDSANAARGSLKATIENFNADQRAWLGITGFKIEKDLTIPENVSNDSAIAGFSNSGRTPAKNVAAIIGLGFEPVDYVLKDADERWFDSFIADIHAKRAEKDPSGWGRGNLRTSYRRFSKTFMGQTLVESIVIGDIAPSATVPYKHLMTWKAGTMVHEFLFGVLYYDDVRGAHHFTKFCVYRPQSADDRMTVCPIFNKMD